MSDLAASLPLRLAGSSGESEQAMLQTDDDTGPTQAHANLDTLAAADVEPDASLDDRLLRRDLKSRIFGTSTRPSGVTK